MPNYPILDSFISEEEKNAWYLEIPKNFIHIVDKIKVKQICYKNKIVKAYFISYFILLKENLDMIELIALIKNLNSTSKIRFLLVFDIPIEKIITFVGTYDIYAYYIHICRISLYMPSKNLIRKHRKANEVFTFVMGENSTAFLRDAFQLVKLADYYISDSKNEKMIEMLINYFNANNKYVVVALDKRENPIGIMCGYQEENKSIKMFCHFYNPSYCKNYLNNGLYFHFIKLCKQNGIEEISYGTTDIHDSGLDKFKSYYSTDKRLAYSMIIPLNKTDI